MAMMRHCTSFTNFQPFRCIASPPDVKPRCSLTSYNRPLNFLQSVRLFAAQPTSKRNRGSTQEVASKYERQSHFVQSEKWATQIADCACIGVKPSKGERAAIILANPGNSVLTNVILDRGTKNVVALEPRAAFRDFLVSIADRYPKSFTYVPKSIQSHVKANLPQIFESHNSCPSRVAVIGNVVDMASYVTRLVLLFHRRKGLWAYDTVEHYLIVTGLEYRLMTEADHFWKSYICHRTSVYSLFFAVEPLLTIPLSAFNKTYLPKKTRRPTFVDYDSDNMFLVKMTLKNDLIETVCKCEEVVGIADLLKVAGRKKRHRVIPELERWCPDIGISLIEIGISMMDQFRDVPLSMWPAVYRALVTNPHYEYSPLKRALEEHDGPVRFENRKFSTDSQNIIE